MIIDNQEIVINKFGICEYMNILDDVVNFWHGYFSLEEDYQLAMENRYSSVCHPPINTTYRATGDWKISECEIYAQYVDINNWKNLKWDEISYVINEYDMIDILVDLLREQILYFYRNGLLESETFREVILKYIVNFDELNTKEDLTYIYKNGFCQVANYLYKNDLISAKNCFIDFAAKLEEKITKTENLPKMTLVRTVIKNINERRCEKMNAQEGLKNLKVFSKKLNSAIDVLASENHLIPAMANTLWQDNGWNNYSGSWLDNGWNNYSGSWMDNGWNNYSGSWMDNGWNNYSGSWTDSGWNNSGTGGGCYITTAAVDYIGLKDDCEELNMLRKYRDKLVEEDPKFRKIVLEYYKIAPQIVEKIYNNPKKDEILDGIYNNMILPVFELLKNGKIEEAKNYYIKAYNELKDRFILQPQEQLVRKL